MGVTLQTPPIGPASRTSVSTGRGKATITNRIRGSGNRNTTNASLSCSGCPGIVP